MGWYDLFSRFYDASVERLYVETRQRAAEALAPRPGEWVLDLPCGTGLSLDGLAPAVGSAGRVVGVDYSAGMLARARQRVARAGWDNVTLLQGDVLQFDGDALASAVEGGRREVDCLHVFLGLTAFPDWRRAAERLWSLLRPGGRLVAVDVYAARPGFQGRMVNLTARADISRPFWEPFEALASDFSMEALPSLRSHGGELRLLRGRKPE